MVLSAAAAATWREMRASFRIAALEAFRRKVPLRLPFRFGVVTLREAQQAFLRVERARQQARELRKQARAQKALAKRTLALAKKARSSSDARQRARARGLYEQAQAALAEARRLRT